MNLPRLALNPVTTQVSEMKACASSPDEVFPAPSVLVLLWRSLGCGGRCGEKAVGGAEAEDLLPAESQRDISRKCLGPGFFWDKRMRNCG